MSHLSLFFKELILVALADILAILAASWILNSGQALPPVTRISVNLPLVIGFLTGLAVLFAIFYFRRLRSWALRFFLALAVFIGASSVAGPLLGLIVLILYVKVKRVWAHDLALMLTMAGIGVSFGLQFSPLIVVGVLVLMSFYDIYAVYRSGHMITMARSMIESNAIPGYILPHDWKNFSASIAEAKSKFGTDYMLLGSGDVIFPILLISSVTRQSTVQGLVVALFSLVGLFITHLLFIGKSGRRPMAALPPIVTMAILGYLITILL